MPRTITMSRKMILAMSTLIVIAAAALGFKMFSPVRPPSTGAGPAQAAVEFTQAYYAVDYRDQQAWLKTLQPMATSEGYALLRSNIAGLIWPSLAQAQIVTTSDQVHVEDKGLVFASKPTANSGSQWQIRAISVSLVGRLWPVMKSASFSTDIMLSNEQGRWKFSTYMTDEQAQAIQQESTALP